MLAATYAYDAWGNVIAGSDYSGMNIRAINPIRYRSYYFDNETGLYYLNSRYYDPETGRFINADEIQYLDPTTLGGLSLYAYCLNNPVKYTDPTGCFALLFSIVLKIAITIAVVTALAATANDIYQLASGNVTAETTSSTDEGDSTDNVQIKDSYKIITPWVQYGYSFYLNHINEDTKDVIDGTVLGTTIEWGLHNFAYTFSSIFWVRQLC